MKKKLFLILALISGIVGENSPSTQTPPSVLNKRNTVLLATTVFSIGIASWLAYKICNNKKSAQPLTPKRKNSSHQASKYTLFKTGNQYRCEHLRTSTTHSNTNTSL